MLIGYAKNNGIAVTFREEDADLLLWAIETDLYNIVRFILEKLTEKCASVEETSDLLTRHLLTIGERCPEMLADLLENDKFTIEYARFQVPKAVFDSNSKIPKTMITRTIPDNWAAMDGEQGKGLWIERWRQEAHSLGTTSDAQMWVVAKVFCINFSVPRKEQNALLSSFLCILDLPSTEEKQRPCEYLYDLRFPVEVFESETMVNFIDHWFRVYLPIYQIIIILDSVATLAFTIFSLTFGHPDEIGNTSFRLLMCLIFTPTILKSFGAYYIRSFRRSATTRMLLLPAISEIDGCRFSSWMIDFTLMLLALYTHEHDHLIKPCAFLMSLMCILQWISVFTKSILPSLSLFTHSRCFSCCSRLNKSGRSSQ